MTFAPEWNAAYESPKPLKSMQDLELNIFISDVSKGAQNCTALELGCGQCHNYPTFRDAGIAYYGIDGSAAALCAGVQRFPALAEKVYLADFTAIELPIGAQIICDRAAIAHNDIASIKRCVKQIYKALPDGGIFIGIDWFSSNHSEANRGERVDERTRTGYEDGQFKGIGNVNFSSQDDLLDLFRDFKIGMLRERTRRMPVPYSASKYMNFGYISKYFHEREYQAAVWDIFAIKEEK